MKKKLKEELILNSPFSVIVGDLIDKLPEEAFEPPVSCEFFDEASGMCRVTSSVCPFYESIYRQCEIRKKALPFYEIERKKKKEKK